MGSALRLSLGTSFGKNPFIILGATTRDNRTRVVELADEGSLIADGDEAHKAQSTLLNIRTRLAAEMGWMPGVAPSKAATAVEGLAATIFNPDTGSDLPPLARANLLSAAAQAMEGSLTRAQIASLFYRLAMAVEDVDLSAVARHINEDRSIAGFPPVRDEDLIVQEFESRKSEYRSAINALLDSLPSRSIVDVMEEVVEKSTSAGSEHAPAFVQEVVASYDLALQGFVEAEAANVAKLVQRGLALATKGEAQVVPVIQEIEKVATNFNKIMGPVQLVAGANGIDHVATRSFAAEIRNLAIDLHNNHNFVDTPARISTFLNDNFGQLDAIANQVSEDLSYLKETAEQRKRSDAEFREMITYNVKIGILFKENVSISPEGITYQERRFALENITRLRWWNANGVNKIFVGTAGSSFQIDTSRQDIFLNLIDRIWKAAGVRLLVEMVRKLRDGEEFAFGSAVIRNDSVVLTRHKTFSANEQVRLSWRNVNVTTEYGKLVIKSRNQGNVYSAIPFQECNNLPVVDMLLSKFLQSGKETISEMFD